MSAFADKGCHNAQNSFILFREPPSLEIIAQNVVALKLWETMKMKMFKTLKIKEDKMIDLDLGIDYTPVNETERESDSEPEIDDEPHINVIQNHMEPEQEESEGIEEESERIEEESERIEEESERIEEESERIEDESELESDIERESNEEEMNDEEVFSAGRDKRPLQYFEEVEKVRKKLKVGLNDDIKTEGRSNNEDVIFLGNPTYPLTISDHFAAMIKLQAERSNDIKYEGEGILEFQMELSCRDDGETGKKFDNVPQDFLELENELDNKISEIFLPSAIKTKIRHFFRPIGLQMYRWVILEIHNGNKVLSKLHWTMEGTLDKTKTFKEAISEASIRENHCINSYIIACHYCLEGFLSEKWPKVSFEGFELLSIECNCRRYKNHIVAYWSAFFQNKLDTLLSKILEYDSDGIYDSHLGVCENMIHLAIHLGNEVILKYFWNKLADHSKTANIERWVKAAIPGLSKKRDYRIYSSRTSICVFLLSQIDTRTQQKEILQRHSKRILSSLFLSWPFQRFFVPTFKMMLEYLQGKVYIRILLLIVSKLNMKHSPEASLLAETWSLSPFKLKKSFIAQLTKDASAIMRLFRFEEDLVVDKILEYTSAEERRKIGANIGIWNEFYECARATKFDIKILDLLVSKLLPSESDFISFKQIVVARHVNSLIYHLIRDREFKVVEKLLKWSFQSSNDIYELKRRHIDPADVYAMLICYGNYECVHSFLKWYFEVDEKIIKFKKKFVHEASFEKFQFLLVSLSRKGKAGWDLFEKFLNYNFTSPEEITQFKLLFMYCIECFIRGRAYEFPSLVLNWCLKDTSEEIYAYKHKYLLSKRGRDLCQKELKRGFKTESLLKMFLPLKKETIDEIKTLYKIRLKSN